MVVCTRSRSKQASGGKKKSAVKMFVKVRLSGRTKVKKVTEFKEETVLYKGISNLPFHVPSNQNKTQKNWYLYKAVIYMFFKDDSLRISKLEDISDITNKIHAIVLLDKCHVEEDMFYVDFSVVARMFRDCSFDEDISLIEEIWNEFKIEPRLLHPCRHLNSIKRYFSKFGGTSVKSVGPYNIDMYVEYYDLYIFCVDMWHHGSMEKFNEVRNYLQKMGPLSMIFLDCRETMSEEDCVMRLNLSIKSYDSKKILDPHNRISILTYNFPSSTSTTSDESRQ